MSADNEIEIDEYPAYYDYGYVLNETIFTLFGDIASFNKLKDFYDNPCGECQLEIRRSDTFSNKASSKPKPYFIDIYVDGERFLETKEYPGSYLNYNLGQFLLETEERKKEDN
jgi:hypothetical protein